MSDEFDAGAAAARAVGKQAEGTLSGDDGPDSGAENHASAEGADSSSTDGVGSTSAWRDMLMSTGPDDALEDVESPWDPDEGGLTRIYRGIRKMTGLDGMPALADIVVGAVEEAHRLRDSLPSDDDGGEQAESDGGGEGEAPDIGGVPGA
jgi:hypothetical protein